MFMNTMFIHSVKSVDITDNIMHSEDENYNQIKIVIHCVKDGTTTETELYLLSNTECKIDIKVHDNEKPRR